MKKKLGTRQSLLAVAQSRWVARQLEDLCQDLQLEVELKGITTQGDQVLDIPLSQIEGKEFFVKELDQALLSGEVDFTVHSLKDLSTERPASIALAAIPARVNPRDVIIFNKDAIEKLKQNEIIRVASSAPRRLENVPLFLKTHLPCFNGKNPQIEMCQIRGNVNTRLAKLQSENIDAVVLAMAGLARLWMDEDGRPELKKLLHEKRWMLLPMASCPSAPGQGALAIECRSEDKETLEILKRLHHPLSARQVKREREILSDWGGGCHLALGATCIRYRDVDMLFVKGQKPVNMGGAKVQYVSWTKPDIFSDLRPLKFWDGMEHSGGRALLDDAPAFSEVLFVTHSKALTPAWISHLKSHPQTRVWVSGESSWKALAEQGIWVEGCGDGLGAEYCIKLMTTPLLNIPKFDQWRVLTHRDAERHWQETGIQTQSSYYLKGEYSSASISALQKATHVFWGSYSQFAQLSQHCGSDVHHACGMGVSFDRLQAEGLKNFDVFPSRELWKQWILDLKTAKE